MVEKIKAFFIFEILGRPAEHIKKALDEFVDKISGNKGIEITSRKIHEPKIIEEGDAKGLFTTFAEVEVVVDNLSLLFGIVVNMLPSSVEVIHPAEIKIDNFDLTPLLAELAIKLHKYDEVAKTLLLENTKLLNRVKEVQEEISRLKGVGNIPNADFKNKNKETKKEKIAKIKKKKKRL